MPPMTEAQCQRAQEACAEARDLFVGKQIAEALKPVERTEAKVDGLISRMDALAQLYGRVGALETWKANLNGHARALAEGHAHHREAEVADRLHTRMEDGIKALEAATAAMDKRAVTPTTTTTTTTTTDGLPALPRWAVIGLAGFVALALALAMYAGERGLWTVKPSLPAPKVVTP